LINTRSRQVSIGESRYLYEKDRGEPDGGKDGRAICKGDGNRNIGEGESSKAGRGARTTEEEAIDFSLR